MVSATNQLTIVASLQDRLSKPLMGIEKSTGRMEKQFTKLSGAVQNAFQFYVRYRIFGLINQGISAVENAIPGLIARGQEWAATVDSIADSTGLAAEKSSLLAGIAQTMTGDISGLDRALGALANTTANHGDVLRRYGIETRNANGQLLDTWTILGNVRKATSDLGNGFITTAAARELFSRGGQKLLDFLTMSDAQFKLLTKDVKESGVIMSDAGLRAAEQWQRTQQRFELTVTGIANQITQNVQPLLSRLVDGITGYLRKNMAQIVGFVVGVVSFVTGAIAGFLGIDISGQMKTFAESFDALAKGSDKRERSLSKAAKTRDEQTASEDGYSKALNRQIEAIDRQLAAMSKADSAEDARREHARLLADIAAAQKELRDLRGEGIFAAGMTNAEAELARQAQAADIVDAQKRIRDANQAMAKQERDTARENRRIELTERREMLTERLADHMKTITKEAAADREVLSQIMGADKGGVGGLGAEIARVTTEARKGLLQADVGTKWGQDFRAQLEGFFDDLNDPTTGLGATFSILSSVGKTVADNWQLVALAGAGIIALNLVGSLASFVGALALARLALAGVGAGVGIAGAAGAGAAGAGGLAIGGIGAVAGGAVLAVVAKRAAEEVVGRNYAIAQPVVDSINKQGDNAFNRLVAFSQQAFKDMNPGGRTGWEQISQALGEEGPLAGVEKTSQTTAARLAPTSPIARNLDRIATNTTFARNQPLGTQNIYIQLDGRTVMSMFGLTIRRGNSTTRVSTNG